MECIHSIFEKGRADKICYKDKHMKKKVDKKFVADQKIRDRLYKRKAEKEKYLYMALCSTKDIEYILGKRILDMVNFERIRYLLFKLGLEMYEVEFTNTYGKLSDELAEKLLLEIKEGKYDSQERSELTKQWEEDFVMQIHCESIRHYIKKIFME